jgi:hypothetical protein
VNCACGRTRSRLNPSGLIAGNRSGSLFVMRRTTILI